MARINKSQFAVLGYISKMPRSGYTLLQLFKRVAPYHWAESNAQVYPILKKLEQAGMLTSKLDKNSGARKKRIYHITPQGLKYLKSWLTAPTEPTQYREELLLKLSCAEQMKIPDIITQLEQYLEQINQRLQELEAIKTHVEIDHQGRPDQPYLEMIYEYAEMTLTAKQQWCRKTLTRLRKRAKQSQT